jgi:hypothetical protein
MNRTSSKAILMSDAGIRLRHCSTLARSIRDLQISMLRSAAYTFS